MPHNFAAKFKLIVPHDVFSVINPYGPLAINVSIPLIPVYSENELYCILLPVQSRVPNHNNFSNFSVPNNGPAAPRLPYQTPEFQPIVLSPSQPTNLSQLQPSIQVLLHQPQTTSQAFIPPLFQPITLLSSLFDFNTHQTPLQYHQHVQPTQIQLMDYCHVIATHRLKHRSFTPPTSTHFTAQQVEHAQTTQPPTTNIQQQHSLTLPTTNASQLEPPNKATNL